MKKKKILYLIFGIGIISVLIYFARKIIMTNKIENGGGQVGNITYPEYYNIINLVKTSSFPNVPIALVYAIIETESSYNPNANNSNQSFGLMQLEIPTAQQFGFTGTYEDLYNPETNIYYGMAYLNWLIQQLTTNMQGVIMSYNEGLGNFEKGYTDFEYYDKVFPRWQNWIDVLKQKGLEYA